LRCGVTLPFESRALPRLQGNAGRMQNATSYSLPLPNTPHIPAIIPPIISHPRLSGSRNGFVQILHQLLCFCSLFFGFRWEELCSNDIDPECGFDSYHETEAGVDRIAHDWTGVLDLAEEVEGGEGWVWLWWRFRGFGGVTND
jgi:hypothetical protein